MRIKLILACAPNDPLKEVEPVMPLSLPLLAGAAPGHDYIFVDMMSGDPVRHEEPVDLVGISSRISGEKTAFELADHFRSRGIPVILGGAQISVSPYAAKEHADAVAVGEAEATWPALLKDLQAGQLKDFYVGYPKPFDAQGHTLHQVSDYLDLADLPAARRDLYQKRYMFNSVFASRGCAIDCDFCSVTGLFGPKLRTRPADEVAREIDTFGRYFYLLDDTVFGRPGSFDYYLDLYDRMALLKKKRFWIGQASLDAAAHEKGREVIRRAAKAGMLWAFVGIESLDDRVLEKSGVIRKSGVKDRKDYLEQMKQNIAFIQNQGIIISGWFTIGYEEDTPESYITAAEFAREVKMIPAFSPLKALAGTQLHDRLRAENRIDDTRVLNIIHPHYTNRQFMEGFIEATRISFSIRGILRRTWYYSGNFETDNPNRFLRIHYRIYKTVFAFLIQYRFRKWALKFVRARASSL